MAPTSLGSLLAPRYWLTWSGLAMLRLITLLPYNLQISIGKLIGWFLWRVATGRRRVTEKNLQLCFPSESEGRRAKMVKKVFENNGIGIVETGMAWWCAKEPFRARAELSGSEYLDRALQQGKGVILLGAHFSTLDLGALLFALYYPVNTVYRPHNNPAMEYVIRKGRMRSVDRLVDRSDFRGMLRVLKGNGILWYAPDQDFGPKHSVYAPFFGIEAASVTATARLAKLSGAPVILFTHHHDSEGRYVLRLHEPVDPFPLETDRESAQRINAEIEKGILYDPCQYMWIHKRFKTHPKGKNYLYQTD